MYMKRSFQTCRTEITRSTYSYTQGTHSPLSFLDLENHNDLKLDHNYMFAARKTQRREQRSLRTTTASAQMQRKSY